MDVTGFALITGAASGIGRSCAKAFIFEGCAGIALLDVNEEALIAVKADIKADIAKQKPGMKELKEGQILTFAVDVTDEDKVNRVVAEVAQAFGRLDYVVNAAGIATEPDSTAAFVDSREWRRVMDVNVNGSFFILKAAAQIMLKQEPILSSITGKALQRGSIINFGSILGVVGISMCTAYTTSKHSIIGLTRTAGLDYAKDGLRINAICPGFTETPMMKKPEVQKAMEPTIKSSVPMGRMAQPEEIADGVLFLAGGRSSFITGSLLFVDGGYTTR